MIKRSILLFTLICFSFVLSTLQAGLPQAQLSSENLEERGSHPPSKKKGPKKSSLPKKIKPKDDKHHPGDLFWPKVMRANKRDTSTFMSGGNVFQGLMGFAREKNDLFWPKRMRANKRDASTLMSGGNVFEGVDHNPIKAPANSSYNILRIGQNNERVGVFWTAKPKQNKATQAFIMIHGKLRNGGEYWTIMNNIVQNAVQNNVQGVDPDAIIVAPQFFSARDNSGQYDNNTLAWADVNAWQAGEKAIHPAGTSVSSFDALDSLANKFLDVTQYPRLQKLTIIGHGGGGQLIQRYATVGTVDSNDRVHIRFIHGDPSSCNYFTTDRPTISGQTLPTKDSCPTYNTWRYGFDNFTASTGTTKKPQDYFQQYISRDVVSIVGYQDTDASGDNYCMAVMQGGSARRDRNLVWWRYINTLAKTGEDLDGFPGSFDNLPDWSNLVKNNTFGVRLLVVEDADHDAELVFESAEGRAALFDVNSYSFPTGWRPNGWKNTSRAIAPALLATKKEPNQPSTSKFSSATALQATTSIFVLLFTALSFIVSLSSVL